MGTFNRGPKAETKLDLPMHETPDPVGSVLTPAALLASASRIRDIGKPWKIRTSPEDPIKVP